MPTGHLLLDVGLTALATRQFLWTAYSLSMRSMPTSHSQLASPFTSHHSSSIGVSHHFRPGTCNLCQVTGQIATLQWSRGPDNVEHVNEG